MKLEAKSGWISAYKCVGKFWYLRKDGTIHTKLRANKGWFISKQEAEQFLKNWLPSKDLLTKEQVRERAEVSDVSALDCSIEHWKQVVFLGHESDGIKINEDYCALCQRYGCNIGCSRCPLNSCWDESPFRKVVEARDVGDASKFEEASVNMLNELINIRNKKYGNPYMIVKNKIYCADVPITKGKEMVELTVGEVAKRLGIDEVKIIGEVAEQLKEKEKYQFEHGDTAVNVYGGNRIIISIDDNLTAFDKYAVQGRGQKYFEDNNYEKTGNVFE